MKKFYIKDICIGDIVKIGFKEGKRVQLYKGTIIKKHKSKITVRTLGVEKIFSYFNPQIITFMILKSHKSKIFTPN
uniref:Ribosomal protein L19 n=1 Tax=Callipsygma wilsonis TaxID=2320807 RepID=A0A386B013_9CHLO|nr:ribosomal protein L19 [Callipsygma wilsonis]AYC65035.1 ribosomal protein L19 [Callipsygma wilsonis]